MGEKKANGELLRLRIDSVNSFGCGVARADDGRVMFVNGTVGGDEVTASVIKSEKNYSVCRLVSLDKPSENRAEEEFCKAPNACGGCTYRHTKYSYELEVKKESVRDAMRRAGISDKVTVTDVIKTGGENGGYRNKVIYPVCGTKNGLRYGYYATGTHKVIPYSDCALTSQITAPIAALAVSLADEYGISAYDESTGKGILRHVYLRASESTREVLVCYVINAHKLPHADKIARALCESFPNVAGVLVNVNQKKTNVILGKDFYTVRGCDHITDTLLGKSFEIQAAAFWQVNRIGAEILYSTAYSLAGIQDSDTLIDLYCGIGSVGLCASDKAKKILGIEIVPQAVECAKRNAERNGISNAEYICADASSSEDAIRKLLCEVPDALVMLDPPRKGCGERLMNFIADMDVKKVLYISCNPYSLATDMKILLDRGYTPSEVIPVDMFPRTGHVESVVCLTRQTEQ